jgi:hypothetical protein
VSGWDKDEELPAGEAANQSDGNTTPPEVARGALDLPHAKDPAESTSVPASPSTSADPEGSSLTSVPDLREWDSAASQPSSSKEICRLRVDTSELDTLIECVDIKSNSLSSTPNSQLY